MSDRGHDGQHRSQGAECCAQGSTVHGDFLIQIDQVIIQIFRKKALGRTLNLLLLKLWATVPKGAAHGWPWICPLRKRYIGPI